MKFELKAYDDNYKYIEYSDEEKNLKFNNAEYFIFDVMSDIFNDIMSTTGGFVANMTTRFIKQENIDVSYIMLCCIPQKYNDFIFRFVYLDNNFNILTYRINNTYFDYQYFKNKFSDCIIKEGFIYELKSYESLNELTKEFYPNPSIDFDLIIEDKIVHYEDSFIGYDFSIFKDEYQEYLKKLNAKYYILKFDCNCLNYIVLNGTIITNNNDTIKCFQMSFGSKTIDDYVNTMKQKHDDYVINTDDSYFTDDFNFALTLKEVKCIANKLKFYKNV